MAKAKEEKHQKVYIIACLFIIFLILIGFVIFKRPSITGRAVQSKQTIYSENLNIKKNESGNYTWQVKNPGSINSLKVTGSATSNGTAKVYVERNGTKYLLFDSTKHLFDVNVQVLPEYKKILQGDHLLMQITLLNLRGFGSGNVIVKYSIKDSKGNLIASQEEPVYIETQAKFVRQLEIPVDIAPGTYIAYVEADTSAVVGSGSDTFEINSKFNNQYPQGIRYYLTGFAVLVALSIVFVLGTYALSAMRKKKKIEEIKEQKPLEKIKKLEDELKALEEAYKSGFISKESFEKEKIRIEDRLKVEKR